MTAPTLSICVPTYNRPAWLRRAIESVVRQYAGDSVEIVVSDNSTGTDSRDIVYETLASWPGVWRYVHNDPTIPMVENFNNAITNASGRFVLMLSDDDYLLPGAVERALEILDAKAHMAACLFGVRIVDENERVSKRRTFDRLVYLPPNRAVERLLTNSSFVRFPGIAVQRSVLLDAGLFDTESLNICDVDMWFKVFSKHGVLCVPLELSAYTVHQHAFTMTMFQPKILELLLSFFRKVEVSGVVNPSRLERYESLFFHQYILAGAFRNLRWNGRAAAREAFALFDHDRIRQLKVPLKWMLLRGLFSLLLGRPRLTGRLVENEV